VEKSAFFLRETTDVDLMDRSLGCVHLITSEMEGAKAAVRNETVLKFLRCQYPKSMQSRYFQSLIVANLLTFCADDSETTAALREIIKRTHETLGVTPLRDIEIATEMRWANLDPFFVLLQPNATEEMAVLTGMMAMAVILGVKMNWALMNDEKRHMLVSWQFAKWAPVRKFWKQHILPLIKPYDVPPLKYLIKEIN
jgi:hypothetical protein